MLAMISSINSLRSEGRAMLHAEHGTFLFF